MGKAKGTVFGNRLRQLRETDGVSQAALAKASELNLSTISKLEQGVREPTWTTVMVLASALGRSVEDFAKAGTEKRQNGKPVRLDGDKADILLELIRELVNECNKNKVHLAPAHICALGNRIEKLVEQGLVLGA